jgi:phosphoadenosine phosphosulfate reductase
MTLVASPRHRVDDLACWEVHEQVDRINARSDRLQQLVERSIAEVGAFASQGRCYASVSWGKDSMVLAHLIATEAPHVPLVHLH